MDCSLPGSCIHGIFQAGILEWVAISYSRGSSQRSKDLPRDNHVSWISCFSFYHYATCEAPKMCLSLCSFFLIGLLCFVLLPFLWPSFLSKVIQQNWLVLWPSNLSFRDLLGSVNFHSESHSFEFSFCSSPWEGGGGLKEMTLIRITNFRDHQDLSFPRAHLIFNAILPVKKESIWQMKNLRLRKENTWRVSAGLGVETLPSNLRPVVAHVDSTSVCWVIT